MHGAMVSSLLEMPTVIDGVEKSTSQVTHRMLAPLLTRLSASARVWSGFSWVLAMANLILWPSTPPWALILSPRSRRHTAPDHRSGPSAQ